MDEIQRNFLQIISTSPECIRSRPTLRGLLFDNYPARKREINLIINAYEIGIVDRLRNSVDHKLTVESLKNTLLNDYSLTDEAATWAIVSWCIFLNLPNAEKHADKLYNSTNKNAKINRCKNAKEFFVSMGCKVVDKRSSGGCLWVIGTESEINKYVIEAEKLFGISGSFCGGGRATSYKPGWFTKDNG